MKSTMLKWEKSGKKKDKVVEAWTSMLTYLECPHCKQVVFVKNGEPVGQLKELIALFQEEIRKERKTKRSR